MRDDNSQDRLPPHDLEAEKGLLGCLLTEPHQTQPEAQLRLHKDGMPLYDLRHQEIWHALVEMQDSGAHIDLVTLRSHLRDNNRLEQIGGMAYLMDLQAATPSWMNMPYYLDIVMEKFRLRRLVAACAAAVERVYDPEQSNDPDALLGAVASEINDLTVDAQPKGERTIKDLVLEAIDRIESRHGNPESRFGIKTGFPDIDNLTTGLQAPEMVVLAARPSCGKTSMAMNIVESAAIDQGFATGVISIEMEDVSLVERMMGSRAKVNLRRVHDMNEREFGKLKDVAPKIAKAPIFIDDSSADIDQIRSIARYWHRTHGIKLIVIDYLQLARSKTKNGQNREREIAQISNGCKALAKELGIPVLVLAQLNRDIDKDKPRQPRLSDLRESGSIEQDADTIMFLWPDKPKGDDDTSEDPRDGALVNLTVAKQRNGPAGETVPLTFIKQYTRFESCSRVSD